MNKLIIPVIATFALAACSAAEDSEIAAPAPTDAAEIDFGDDTGDWANDGECDDSRFEGSGMTNTILLDEDIGHDATDCRTAFEQGDLQLRASE